MALVFLAPVLVVGGILMWVAIESVFGL